MVTGPALLVIFVVGIAAVLIAIMAFKVNPFMALVSIAILIGLASGMPLTKVANTISTGFGNTMGGIGIVIALGVILGEVLYRSGCTEQIANTMLRLCGKEKTTLAINLTGYIVSIPVFFDAAFVILIALVKQLSRKSKLPFAALVTALAVGLISTQAIVLPTPGPLAVVDNLGANLGLFLLYSIFIALPAALVGGVLYGKIVGWMLPEPYAGADIVEFEKELESKTEDQKPSGGLAIFLILLPIIMILLGTIVTVVMGPENKESFVYDLFSFVGNKNIALLVGVLTAIVACRKYFKSSVDEMINDCGKSIGIIFLITAGGGSFGAMINATGIADTIVSTMQGLNMSTLILAWVLAQVMRLASGSTTVALVTTSAILAPVIAQMDISPILVGLMICCGGIGLSMPNDSGFWIINRLTGFSVKDTIRTWVVGGTLCGVVGGLCVLGLSKLSGILPGL